MNSPPEEKQEKEENAKLDLKLTELRSRWEKEWQRNTVLEGKANTLMQVGGIFLGL